MVINVIGFFEHVDMTLSNELFAIDSTKRALLVSEDGVNFKSCHYSRYKLEKIGC